MNELITMQQGPGGWMWDGTQWICCPPDGCAPPCPPPPCAGPPPWYPPPQGQPPWYPGANGGVSFGSTAPPNPIRGAFWWDGTVLWLFDGAVWEDIGGSGSTSGGGGSSSGPNPPSNPADGALWFNGTTLYIWDGNAWVPTSQTQVFVQATAPAAPNAGDQWWDGATMRIWDGSKWNAVGPGQAAGPVPTTTQTFSMVSANVTGISTTPAAAWSTIPFVSSPAIDIQNAWNATNQRITPTKAGYYYWILRGWKGGNQSEVGGALVRNDNGSFNGLAPGGNTICVFNDATPPATGAFQQTAGICHMNGTTDFIRPWGGASPDGVYNTIPNVPVIEGYLLP